MQSTSNDLSPPNKTIYLLNASIKVCVWVKMMDISINTHYLHYNDIHSHTRSLFPFIRRWAKNNVIPKVLQYWYHAVSFCHCVALGNYYLTLARRSAREINYMFSIWVDFSLIDVVCLQSWDSEILKYRYTTIWKCVVSKWHRDAGITSIFFTFILIYSNRNSATACLLSDGEVR